MKWYGTNTHKIDAWINGADMNPHLHGQLIYDKGGKNIQWRNKMGESTFLPTRIFKKKMYLHVEQRLQNNF